MASSSSCHHVRSATYPPNTNPVILKIEQQLKNLRQSEVSSNSSMQTISIGLTGLAGLYKCIDEALNHMPLLPQHNTKDHLKQLVDGALKLLEVCTGSKEVLVRLREAVGRLTSSHEKLIEVSRYFCTRKETVRSAKRLTLRLSQVEGELMPVNRELSQEELQLTRAIRCVSIISISVLESLLQLLSSKLHRSNRFSLIPKLRVGRSKEAQESLGRRGNELRKVDIVLHAVSPGEEGDEERMVMATKILENLEEGLRGIENGLNFITSQLAKTRTSLVNIVSS